MCKNNFHPRTGPVKEKHLIALKALFPKQAEFIQDIYDALVKNLTPQVNILAMFAILKKMADGGHSSNILGGHHVLYVPLSLVAKTTDGWARYRTPSVSQLHSSILSFMMAETNRLSVENVCNAHGLRFGQSHCCGVLFGTHEAIETYQQSELYKDRNEFRSGIESAAMAVHECETFSEVPGETIDLGLTETDFFRMYDTVFESIKDTLDHDAVDSMTNLDHLWNKIKPYSLATNMAA